MTPLEVWKPNRRAVRWMVSQWCNYSCTYCQQNHSRQQLYKGSAGHCFDNRSRLEWFDALQRHFSPYQTSFHLTGGEPMVDRKNMLPFLKAMLAEPWVALIDIDTNGSFDPSAWDIPLDKVELQVSFHYEHVTSVDFLRQVDGLLQRGWKLQHIAAFYHPNAPEEWNVVQSELAARGIPMNPIPYYGTLEEYSSSDAAVFHKLIPDSDAFHYGKTTLGRSCLYPAIGYEIDPDGSLITACHRSLGAQYHGSIWNETLPPLWDGYGSCPKTHCPCDERFTFLQELDANVSESPRREYANRLRKHQGIL